VARVASIQAGLPMESVAMAVNRLCSSGLQAIVTTAQNILLGDCDYGVGGGVEVMSRGAYLMPGACATAPAWATPRRIDTDGGT
jgi:acetyl-CoA C-acetyltransferase